MDTGTIIKERRKALGMSADDLAEAIGVSRSTMFRYENGSIEKIPLQHVGPIARKLRCSSAYLMGWSDDPGEEELAPVSEGELDEELVSRLQKLTPSEIQRVDDFVQGLLASHKEDASPQS